MNRKSKLVIGISALSVVLLATSFVVSKTNTDPLKTEIINSDIDNLGKLLKHQSQLRSA